MRTPRARWDIEAGEFHLIVKISPTSVVEAQIGNMKIATAFET